MSTVIQTTNKLYTVSKAHLLYQRITIDFSDLAMSKSIM